MESNKPYSKILIENINGQHWNFYILDNKLFYIVNDYNSSSKKQVKLIDNVKTYDIAVDAHNNIHLVYSCHGGKFCYMKYSSNIWIKKTFYESNEKVEIDFINILTNDDSVHIFYAYKNNKLNKYYKIFHIYKSADQWTYTQVAKVPVWKVSIPYWVDCDVNRDIVMVFMARFQGYNKVHYKIFNSKNSIWSVSKGLNFNKRNAVIKNYLIDSRGNHHFIYHDNASVYYGNNYPENSDPAFNSSSINASKHLSDRLSNDYQIFECNDKIFISCNDEDIPHCFTSNDLGKTWDKKTEYELSDLLPTKLIHIKDSQVMKPIITMDALTNEVMDLLGITNFYLQEQSDKPVPSEINESQPTQDGSIVDNEDISVNDTEESITNTSADMLYDFHTEIPIEPEDYSGESILKKLKKFFTGS